MVKNPPERSTENIKKLEETVKIYWIGSRLSGDDVQAQIHSSCNSNDM